ncbi:MAG: NUDIX domain-containing protein [Phycisphaerales bacterium]
MSAQSDHNAPEIIARGVLTRGSSVLVCRNLARGYMYLPGGHVELGETAAEALAREFEEETGLAVKVGRCEAVAEVLFGQGSHEINMVFHVKHPGELGDAVESKEDDIGFEWLEHAAIVDADLRPRSIKAWLVGGGDSSAQGIEFISDRQDD